MPLGYYPSLPPLNLERPNLGNTILGTMGAVQDIETRRQKNALLQDELQRRQNVKGIMQEFDPADTMKILPRVMAADPEYGLKLAEAFDKMDDRQARQTILAMEKGSGYLKMALPGLRSPEQLRTLKADLQKYAPNFPIAYLPDPEHFKDLNEFNNWKTDTLAFTKKQDMVLEQLKYRNRLDVERLKGEYGLARAGITAEGRMNQGARGYKPELLEDPEGNLEFVSPSAGTLPGYRKPQARPENLEKEAARLATAALRGNIAYVNDPNSPESRQLFAETKKHMLDSISPKGKPGNISGGGGDKISIIKRKLAQIPPERRAAALERIKQNDPEVYKVLVGGQ